MSEPVTAARAAPPIRGDARHLRQGPVDPEGMGRELARIPTTGRMSGTPGLRGSPHTIGQSSGGVSPGASAGFSKTF